MRPIVCNHFILFITLLFLFETSLLTFWNNLFGWKFSPLILFFTSLSIGIFPLYYFYRKKIIDNIPEFLFNKNKLKQSLLLLQVFLVCGIIIAAKLNVQYGRSEINWQYSDIIPSIQELIRRFFAGEYVYTPITKWGYYMPVTYLPAHWMPFIPAQFFQFDFRWIPYAVWLVAAVGLAIHILKYQSNFIISSAQLFFTFLILFLVWNYHPGIFSMTVEVMIAGYYMLAIQAIAWRNNWLKAIPFILCLLSRYSLIFWMPLFIIVLFFEEKKLHSIKVALTVFIGILFIYIIPFLSKDWMIFYNGYKYYDHSAFGEWHHLNEAGLPYHLFSGTGFACYFYKLPDYFSIPEKIKIIQKTHLVISVITIICLGLWYYAKGKNINYKIFLFSSLKIYLTVFYAFMQVPYLYLFMVPLFVSLALVIIITNQVQYSFIEKS
jgi:hypothetical protein